MVLSAEGGVEQNSNGESIRFAPQESGIRELVWREAHQLRLEIERQFMATGELDLLSQLARSAVTGPL